MTKKTPAPFPFKANCKHDKERLIGLLHNDS